MRSGKALRWALIAAAILYSTIFAAIAFAYEVRGPETRGGQLSGFILKLDRANRVGEEIRITSRKCYSSCTIYLVADRMCASRRTVYGFHCFASKGVCSPKWNAYAANELAKLNPILSKWFLDGPANTRKLVKVSGSTMIDHYGAKEC